MPNTVKCFADITEDSSYLFSIIKCVTESVIDDLDVCLLFSSKAVRL